MSLFSFSKKRAPKAASNKNSAETDGKKNAMPEENTGCCGGCGGSGHPPKNSKPEQDEKDLGK